MTDGVVGVAVGNDAAIMPKRATPPEHAVPVVLVTAPVGERVFRVEVRIAEENGTGKVRISFTGRLHSRTVAFAAKIVAFKQDGLTVIFKLDPRTAAKATISVSAKLDHQLAVTSTLQRRPRH